MSRYHGAPSTTPDSLTHSTFSTRSLLPAILATVATVVPWTTTGCAHRDAALAPEPRADSEEARPEPIVPSPYDEPEVVAIRQAAREMLREQASAYWDNWTRGRPLNLDASYDDRDFLFTLDSLQVIRSARQRASEIPELDDDTRALRALELYIAGELVSQATAELAEQANAIETEAMLSIGRIQRPYRELDRLLAGEGSSNARARLYASATPVIEELNPILLARHRQNVELVQELGFGGYDDFGALLREADLASLERLAERTLEATESMYSRAMDDLVREVLGLSLEQTRRSDIPRLFRGPGLDESFSTERLVAGVHNTFSGLGIDLRDQPGLRLDLSSHPLKNPRAVCFPVDVPDDVRVSIKPLGGAGDYRALLHELGHAQHYLHTRRPEWELRQLGGNTVAEAWAFLFDGLVDNPLWLQEQGLDEATAASRVRANATQKLYMLRRYAAKVLFEIRWHSGALDVEPQEAYRQHLSRAYGFELNEDDARRWLVDHDEFLHSADYLRAWFLAAQIERYLETQFGERWWRSTDAGSFLASLWREGSRLTPDELAVRVGEPEVNTRAMAEWLRSRLGG